MTQPKTFETQNLDYSHTPKGNRTFRFKEVCFVTSGGGNGTEQSIHIIHYDGTHTTIEIDLSTTGGVGGGGC